MQPLSARLWPPPLPPSKRGALPPCVSGEAPAAAAARLRLRPEAACPSLCRPTFSRVSQRTILRLLVWASVRVLEAGRVEQRSSGGCWAQPRPVVQSSNRGVSLSSHRHSYIGIVFGTRVKDDIFFFILPCKEVDPSFRSPCSCTLPISLFLSL